MGTVLVILSIAAVVALLFVFLSRRVKAADEKRHAMTDPIRTVVDRASLEEAFKVLGLEEHWPKALPLVRDQVVMHTTPIALEELPLGASRIGGVPDLPRDMSWPMGPSGGPLGFLAQVDLEEAAPHEHSGLLPRSGWLCFFYGSAGADVDPETSAVLFVEGAAADMERKAVPDSVPEDLRFKPCSIRYEGRVSLPLEFEHKDKLDLPLEQGDLLMDPLMRDSAGNKLLGWPDSIQGPPEEEAVVAVFATRQGNGTIAVSRDDVRLLFQIDSEEGKTGMMWGDAGMMYFLLPEADLKARRFDRGTAIVQCY